MSKEFDEILKIIVDSDMCWETAKAVMDLVQDEPYKKIYSIDEFCNYVSSLDFNILLIEFHITSKDTFTDQEKDDLVKAFNLSNRGSDSHLVKYDNLRFLTHAFNIFKYNNRISIGQSWLGKFKWRHAICYFIIDERCYIYQSSENQKVIKVQKISRWDFEFYVKSYQDCSVEVYEALSQQNIK